jgi:L-asparagine oxygenase
MATLVSGIGSMTFEISGGDADRLVEVATAVGRPYDDVDDVAWLSGAREAFEETPAALRKAIRTFRRHTGDEGVMLIRGLPVPDDTDLGATPSVEGSVQRKATVSAAVLLMVASGLGDPAAFRQEKSGALVHDVVPVPGREEFQGNTGSALLTFHNENAFHPHRPDYVLLYCLRADHERTALLRTSCVRSVLPQLSVETRAALFRPEFRTDAPPSFGGSVPGGGEPHAVLFGAHDDPEIRVDAAATRPLTERARTAFAELEIAFERTATSIALVPGDLAIVDNRATVHGRSAFRPRYDGMDRWLQRTYVLADLRRSRRHRPGDGHVLAR